MKKEENKTPVQLPPPPEVTLNGRKYRFEDLTVEQMEAVSEMLESARKTAYEQLVQNADGISKVKNITFSVTDILAELRREKKLSKFIAAVMTAEEAVSDSDKDADFKKCKYEKAEEIFSHFFYTGMFWKMLIPNFSVHPRAEAANRES